MNDEIDEEPTIVFDGSVERAGKPPIPPPPRGGKQRARAAPPPAPPAPGPKPSAAPRPADGSAVPAPPEPGRASIPRPPAPARASVANAPAPPSVSLPPAPTPARTASRVAAPPTAVEAETLPSLDVKALAASIEAALKREESPLRKARLHRELGQLLMRAPGADLKRAVTHLLAARDLQPEDVAAITGARRALLELGRFAEALPLFDAELAQSATPVERARVLYARGQVLETRMGNEVEALSAYQQALALDEANLDLLRAAARIERKLDRFAELDRTLERMAAQLEGDPALRAALSAERAQLAELHLNAPRQSIELYAAALAIDPNVGGASEAVKRLAESQGQWRQLIRVLEQEALRAEHPARSAAAHARRAELLVEQLGERDEAIAALRAAVAELPSDTVWLERLATLLEQAGRKAEALTVLEQLYAGLSDPSYRVQLAYRMGQLAERGLRDPARAQRHYQAALQIDRQQRAAREALAALHARAAQHRELIQVYELELDAETSPGARADVLVRLGEVHEAGLQDAPGAAERYRGALALVADHGLALRALDRLLPELERFDELVQVYERVVDHAPDDGMARNYLMRIGALQEDRLHDFAAAMHAYRRVLERDPRDLPALHALQRAAARAADHAEWLKALDAEAALVAEGPRWSELMYRTAATAADAMDQPALAVDRLRRLLEVDPTHTLALRRLGELYRRLERWNDLLANLAQRLTLAGSPAQRLALSLEMGQLCEAALGDLNAAVAHYRRALEIDPQHQASHLALLSVLRRAEDHEALAAALSARIAVSADAREQAHLAFELGSLLEHVLKAPERALQAYARALAAAPDLGPAADARARLLSDRGAHQALVEALAADDAHPAEPWFAREDLLRAAAVQSAFLGDAKGAARSYRRVLDGAPDQLGAQLALEALHHRLNDRDALPADYAQQLVRDADPRVRAALLRDLAHAHDALEGDEHADAALKAYRELLLLCPEDGEALQALAAAARSDGRTEEVLAHAAALAKSTRDPALAALRYTELAEGHEPSDPVRALTAYRMALSLDGECQAAIRGLARAAAAAGDAGALAEAALRESRAGTDLALAGSLFVRAARLHRTVGELSQAAQALEQALELQPHALPAASALSELLESSGEVARLCELLARAADRGPDPQRAAVLYTQVAELRSGALDDLTGAITAAERALRHEAGHAPALRLLATLLTRSGQWERAAQTHEAAIKASPTAPERRHDRLAIARLAMERLEDPARAERYLKEVLRADPDDREALVLMGGLHHKAGRLDAGLEIARRLVDTAEDGASRMEALLALARGLELKGELGEAELATREALAAQGPGGTADQAYRARIGEHFRWELYVEALRGHLEELRRRAAPIGRTACAIANAQLDGLTAPAQALRTLEQACEAEPDDPELWDRLARLLVAQGAIDRALQVYRTQLAAYPGRPQLWQGLSAAHASAGRAEEALAAGQPLLSLGAAEGKQLVELTARQARPATATGPLAPGLLSELDPEGALEGPAAMLTQRLVPILMKLYPAGPERYGCGDAQRLAEDASAPLRLVVDRVARNLDAVEFQVYVHDQAATHAELLIGEPPLLMVPSRVAALPRSALVFHVARPLLLIGRGLAPVAALEPKLLAVALAATVRRQQPSYGAGLAPEPELEAAEKAISKAIPWLARKKIDEAAAGLLAAGPVDLVAWIEQVRLVAARVALLLSDDVNAALAALATEAGGSPFEDGTGKELLGLWASETAVRHRPQART